MSAFINLLQITEVLRRLQRVLLFFGKISLIFTKGNKGEFQKEMSN